MLPLAFLYELTFGFLRNVEQSGEFAVTAVGVGAEKSSKSMELGNLTLGFKCLTCCFGRFLYELTFGFLIYVEQSDKVVVTAVSVGAKLQQSPGNLHV